MRPKTSYTYLTHMRKISVCAETDLERVGDRQMVAVSVRADDIECLGYGELTGDIGGGVAFIDAVYERGDDALKKRPLPGSDEIQNVFVRAGKAFGAETVYLVELVNDITEILRNGVTLIRKHAQE